MELFHNQTIMNWVKKAGLKVLKKSKVKIDELHMYIKRSEEHEFGLLSIGKRFEVSPGKTLVLRKLIDRYPTG